MERLPDDADRGPKTMSQIPKARNSASRLRAFLLLARDKTTRPDSYLLCLISDEITSTSDIFVKL